MKDLRKLLIYLAASLVLGALLAPLLFKVCHPLAERGIFSSITGQGFHRYFNRSVQIAAILLLWPLARSMRVHSLGELGLQWDTRWPQRLCLGFFAATVLMALMALAVSVFGGVMVRPAEQRLFGEIPKVILTAFCVGFIEECVFRGAFLGLLQRSMSPRGALLASSVFFAVLHFIQPLKSEVASESVTWTSGFALIPTIFSQWKNPAMIGASFTTLLAVGWVLGWAMQRTRSLWLGIGLHAGWVFCVQGFGKFAFFSAGMLPWIGADIRVGIAPLVTVIITGLVCRAWLAHGNRNVSA